jgi:SAM-dependent methyltransferase
MLPKDVRPAIGGEMTQSSFPTFRVPLLNAMYEGEYDERAYLWYTLGAVDKANNLCALLGERAVDSVLEVGCGAGAVLAAVAARGVGTSHCGVDMADPRLHKAPQAASLSLNLYDGECLPFGDCSIDLVYASHVVEHVLEPRRFVREMARVAAKWLYFEVPCELHARTSAAALQRTLDIGHINAYTPESFVLMLQTAGLLVVDVRVFDLSADVQAFHTSWLSGQVKRLVRSGLLAMSPRLATRVFTYHVGVLCEALPPR